MAVLKVESPQHPGDWPRHRLTCDTPLGFIMIGVDPHCATSFRQGGGHRSISVAPCTKLVNRRFTALVILFLCLLSLFPFLLVETLSMEVCLLGLYLSLCPCPCPGPWFCSSCLASSGALSLALVPVLALARCLSPWLCLCFFRSFFVVFSSSFLSLLYCAPGLRQGIARFPRIVFAIACVIYSSSTTSGSSCVSVT